MIEYGNINETESVYQEENKVEIVGESEKLEVAHFRKSSAATSGAPVTSRKDRKDISSASSLKTMSQGTHGPSLFDWNNSLVM